MPRPLCAFKLLAGFIALAVAASACLADDFPSRPIRIVEPYPPGGPSDVGIRLMVKSLSGKLGQSLVVENKGGAGGLVGTEAFLNTPPDGYTLPSRAVWRLYETSDAPLGSVSIPDLFQDRKNVSPELTGVLAHRKVAEFLHDGQMYARNLRRSLGCVLRSA